MFSLPENLTFGYWDSSVFGDINISQKRVVTQFEIELHLEDGNRNLVNGESNKIIKNYILVAKPGDIRQTVLPLKTAYIKFDAEGELNSLITKLPRHFPCRQYDEFLSLINKMLSFRENKLLLYSTLLSLLNLVIENSKISSEKNNYSFIKEAKSYIEKHFSENIKLKDIAANVHLSEIYFHTIFKENLGISPHKYLTDYRINKAKLYLLQNDKSISEIAELTGFGCQQYFNKVFKKETGFTPASYRKSIHSDYLL